MQSRLSLLAAQIFDIRQGSKVGFPHQSEMHLNFTVGIALLYLIECRASEQSATSASQYREGIFSPEAVAVAEGSVTSDVSNFFLAYYACNHHYFVCLLGGPLFASFSPHLHCPRMEKTLLLLASHAEITAVSFGEKFQPESFNGGSSLL